MLEEFKTWMEAQRRRASSKTALGKALQYALARWDALTRYADDGRLAIDNNLAERLLRGIHPARAAAELIRLPRRQAERVWSSSRAAVRASETQGGH